MQDLDSILLKHVYWKTCRTPHDSLFLVCKSKILYVEKTLRNLKVVPCASGGKHASRPTKLSYSFSANTIEQLNSYEAQADHYTRFVKK